jgi:hypothetical protein
MWRVLKMASRARTVCTKIELELASVMENMVKENEMKDMYSGSTGYDSLTKDGARQLKNNMQSVKEKIELLVVAMNANYVKGYKKAAVTRGGGGAVSGSSGGAGGGVDGKMVKKNKKK